jgi:hypothetical protein
LRNLPEGERSETRQAKKAVKRSLKNVAESKAFELGSISRQRNLPEGERSETRQVKK